MKDQDKTKEQLINELVELRQRVAELQAADTARKQAEEALRESQQLLEKTFASLLDAFFIIDTDTEEIIDCNPAASEIFGYSRQEMLGRMATFLHVDEAAKEEFRRHLYSAIQEEGFLSQVEFKMKRKDGTVFPTEHSVMSLEDEQGKRIGWVSVVRDITERKQAEEALRTMLLVDELTGLHNRRGFFNLAEQQLKVADRTKRRKLLVFADLDDLKRINDALGHREGDRALIEIANVLKETFRESDIIARIGGDEFVVLAIETDEASAEVLTTRLQENLEARNAEGDRRYKLSLSVGIARYDPEHPCSIDELVARADRLMYDQRQDN